VTAGVSRDKAHDVVDSSRMQAVRRKRSGAPEGATSAKPAQGLLLHQAIPSAALRVVRSQTDRNVVSPMLEHCPWLENHR
jgi:hypothetical protein